MKILVRAPFTIHSGYGKDGCGLVSALLEAGHDVQILPVTVEVPIPPQVADLLTIDPSPPFDIAIHHVAPGDAYLPKSLADTAKVNIWWSMWEFENLPEGDDEKLREDIVNYDFVIAYDALSRSVFEPLIPEGAEIFTVQGGYDSSEWEAFDHFDLPESPFIFGMVGQMSPRKNPLTAIMAFTSLKQKHGDEFDAVLAIKTTQLFLPPGLEFDGVGMIYENWKHEQLQDFYQSLGCLLAPSWGEGKNLPAIEALSSGTPVILSDISGHRQWAHPSFVRFVPTHRDQVLGLYGGRVDTDELAEAMWDVYTNRREWYAKALQYSRFLPRDMDWSTVIERLGLTIGVLL